MPLWWPVSTSVDVIFLFEWTVKEASSKTEIGASREITPESSLLCKYQNVNIAFLDGDCDILSFFNRAFTSNSPANDEKRMFSLEILSLEEIYKRTTNYIGRFRNEKDNLQSFILWVKKYNPAFMSVDAKRLRVKDDKET